MACLTLVAGGMTAEDRNAWVQVARATLSGIPADLLAHGCKEARRKCRFASDIVPTIIEATEKLWEQRKQRLADEEAAYRNRFAPRIEEKPPEYVDPAELKKLLKSLRSSMASQ